MSDSEPEVEFELEEFTIGGRKLSITTIAYMPITLLMKNRDKQTEISGQKLWCGSLGVIQYCINNPETVKGKAIIELGAGTGVLGMICQHLGSKSVALTDHDQQSIKHMQDDCARNAFECGIHKFDWYNPTYDGWTISENDDVVIVAGDVLYKHALLAPFFKTVSELFSKFPNTTMYLCHIPRAGVDYSLVIQHSESSGLQITEISRELWSTGQCFEYCDPDDLSRARLYHLERPKV